MRMTYKTRRSLQRVMMVLLSVALVAILFGFCWNVWVERYVVYTREGATLDFSRSPLDTVGWWPPHPRRMKMCPSFSTRAPTPWS